MKGNICLKPLSICKCPGTQISLTENNLTDLPENHFAPKKEIAQGNCQAMKEYLAQQ